MQSAMIGMQAHTPFRMEPSLTTEFAALGDADVDIGHDFSRIGFAEPLRAVVVGGGTGAPVSIRSLLSLGVETCAVVAMADDGGSTGILRDKANVSPPGDVRKCIAAFADDPCDPLVKAFKYRLAIADDHVLGNLLLAALEDACGSFPQAIEICERLVNAQGHVYPSTLDRVTLTAQAQDGRIIHGQAEACHSATALAHVSLKAENGTASAYRCAVRAIRDADLVVLGPGSLFTSIIPNLLVPGIIEAIRDSDASVLFICSVADVQGETWGLSAKEHVQALYDHGMEGLLDYVLVHSEMPLRADSPENSSFEAISGKGLPHASSGLHGEPLLDGVRPVKIDFSDMRKIQLSGPIVISRDLADREHPTWHSPSALRNAILQVIKLTCSRRH